MTPHFSLEELTFSSYAVRHGFANSPPVALLPNLLILAQGLERVRALLGHPMNIASAYRCPVLNGWVGGSKTSAHMQGLAADFTCPAFGTPLEVCRAIRDSEIEFDQLINEMSWVHVSFDPRLRCACLTKPSPKAPLQKGLV